MGSGKGEQTVGYKYFLGLHAVLCKAPITGLLGMAFKDKHLWKCAEVNRVDAIDSTTRLEFDKPNLFGGEDKEGGFSGNIDVLFGGDDQLENDYLKSKLGTDLRPNIPAFKGTTSMVWRRPYVGANNPYVKPWQVKAYNTIDTYNGASWNPAIAPIYPRYCSDTVNVWMAVDNSAWMTGYDPGGLLPPYLSNKKLGVRGAIADWLDPLENDPPVGTVNFHALLFDSGVIAQKTWADVQPAQWPEIENFLLGNEILQNQNGGCDWYEAIAGAPDFFTTYDPDFKMNGVSFGLTNILTGSTGTGDANPINGKNKIVIFHNGRDLPSGSAQDAANLIARMDPRPEVYVKQIFDDAYGTYPDDPDGLDYAIPDNCELVDNTKNGNVPSYSETVERIDIENMPGSSLTITGYRGTAAVSLAGGALTWVDINPAHILRDLVVNPALGGDGDESVIGDTFDTVAQTLYNETFGLSFFLQNPSAKGEFKKKVERHIDGVMYFDRGTGLWELKLIRDDYNVGDLFTFDGSNIVEWVDPASRPQQDELPNQLKLKYTKWDQMGEVGSLTITNIAAVQQTGRIVPDEVEYEGITFRDLAVKVALRDLAARTTPLWSGAIRVAYAPVDINVGSAIIIDEPRVGMNSVVCRVKEIEEGDGRDNSVLIRFLEDKFAIDTTASIIADDEDVGGTVNKTALAPNFTWVEEIPYYIAVTKATQSEVDDKLASDPGSATVIATADEPNGAHIGAYIVEDVNGTWTNRGTSELCPYGILSEPMTDDPTDTTIVVPENDTLVDIYDGQLLSVESEIMRVDAISVVDGVATITVGRGCLDTVPAAHGEGTFAVFWQYYEGVARQEYTAGESVDFKVLPFTGEKILGLQRVDTDTVLFDSRAIRPYPVGRFQIDGAWSATELLPGQTATFTWAHRDRSAQTYAAVDDYLATDIGPETGVSYRFTATPIFADDSLGTPIEVTALAQATSHYFTEDGSAPDTAVQLRFEVDSLRDGYENWQVRPIEVSIFTAPQNLTVEFV